MSDHLRRPGAWFAGGIAAAVLLVVFALALVTRTDWGRGFILGYTLQALGGQLNGELVVDRLEGNLFTGARAYQIAVRDLEGDPLIVADSALIEYDLPTFLGGDIIINRLVVYHPDVFLRRLPEDTLWNYQRILQDTAEAPGAGRATLIERLRLVDAEVVVRLPWEPTEGQSEREREREIEAALADTSRLVVERAPGGFVRTIRAEVDEAVATRLTIAPDERGGTYLAVEDAVGELWLYQDAPLRIAGLEGELALREGVLRYEAPVIRPPGSVLQSAGVIDLTGEEPRYDLLVAGEGVDLADLQWLYPPLPDRGELTATLWLETRPDGLFFLVRDARLVTPGTRLAGDFGLIVGETLRFVEADLTADPLDEETVRQLLPAGLPVEGLRIGSVVIESPAS